MVKKIVNNFNLDAFALSPLDLPKSANVDILLFVSGMKPAIRIGVLDDNHAAKLHKWAIQFGYFSKIDEYGFVFVSKINNVEYLINIDQSLTEHTEELGELLGYPNCCVKNISNVGESNIDLYEKNIVYNWKFEGDFKLINPKLYLEGCSLISHIPCSPNCIKSLYIAKKALSIVINNKSHQRFSNFKKWFLHEDK